MTAKPVGHGDYQISSDYLILLAEIAFERGISAAELLRNTGLPESLLFQPNTPVGHESALAMLEQFCEITEDPSIALEFGKRMTLSKHGALGYAAQYSETMVDAAQKVVRYIETRTQIFEVERQLDEHTRHLYINLKVPTSKAGPFLLLAFLASVETICRSLVPIPAREVNSQIRVMSNTDMSQQAILPRCQVISGQDVNCLSWPRQALEGQLAFFDPKLENLAQQELEHALDSINETNTISARVRTILGERLAKTPTVEDVASMLCMSSATLNRKLKIENRSFQQLKDEVRFIKAQQLLTHSSLSIDIIAEQLGYSDSSNFAKAFKGWADTSPSQFRSDAKQ